MTIPLTVTEVHPRVHMANYIPTQAGASWGPRRIPDYELILVVSGTFSYHESRRRVQPLRPGEILLIPPGVRHVLACESDFPAARISCIHAELAPEGRALAGDYELVPRPPRRTSTGGDPTLHYLFKRCGDTFSRYTRYRDELLSTMVREIWLRMAAFWDRENGRPEPSRRVRQMQDYLRQHLAEPVGRRELAAEFHVTPQYVNALFKRELDVSPGAFVNRERVFRAYRLLSQEGCSVKEAAHRVGFSDPFHFSRVFKKTMHIAPSRVR